MVERTPPGDGATHVDGPVALELLRLVEQNPQYSQRQLSAVLGISLGRVHYVLKALLARGWIKAQNFRRSDNKIGYLYVLTPSGVRRRLHLAKTFLAIKEAEYEALRRQIALLRREVASTPVEAMGEEPPQGGPNNGR